MLAVISADFLQQGLKYVACGKRWGNCVFCLLPTSGGGGLSRALGFLALGVLAIGFLALGFLESNFGINAFGAHHKLLFRTHFVFAPHGAKPHF